MTMYGSYDNNNDIYIHTPSHGMNMYHAKNDIFILNNVMSCVENHRVILYL